jgi:hypothetical protein
MLGSGSGEIETLLAGAKLLKKTIIDNGKSTVVPGLETAMCFVAGLSILSGVSFLVIAPEYVPCSPCLILQTLNLDCGGQGTEGHALRLGMPHSRKAISMVTLRRGLTYPWTKRSTLI